MTKMWDKQYHAEGPISAAVYQYFSVHLQSPMLNFPRSLRSRTRAQSTLPHKAIELLLGVGQVISFGTFRTFSPGAFTPPRLYLVPRRKLFLESMQTERKAAGLRILLHHSQLETSGSGIFFWWFEQSSLMVSVLHWCFVLGLLSGSLHNLWSVHAAHLLKLIRIKQLNGLVQTNDPVLHLYQSAAILISAI